MAVPAMVDQSKLPVAGRTPMLAVLVAGKYSREFL
jgi:hypothetical protein